MKDISNTLLASSLIALFIYPRGFVIWGTMISIALVLGSLCKLQGRDEA